MSTLIIVLVVAVQVNTVAVITLGTIDSIVALFVSTIGVGQRHDVNVKVVHQVDDAAVGAGAEFVNEAQHENHTRNLIAMHCRSIEELRLAFGVPIVNADP